MNDGTSTRALQRLQQSPPAISDESSADILASFLALGAACANASGPVEASREAVRLIIEGARGVVSAAVYGATDNGRRAALQAAAGTMSATRMQRVVDLSSPYELPRDVHDRSSGLDVIALQTLPDAPILGWLCVEMREAATPASDLFHRAAAQTLAIAFERAAVRASEKTSRDAAVRHDEATSAYLHDVVNEVRTPLTLLLAPLESAVERQQDAGLQAALRQGHRLKRTVEQLLDLSLIDAGRIDTRLQPIDLAAMTRDIASLFQGAAAAAGVTLTIDCPPLPQSVQVDRQHWEQIVINLVGNAVRSAPSGQVTLSLRASPGLATLDVCDTGRGIHAGELTHVFDRFNRSPDSDQSALGLSLVRELVRLQGGDISATSTVGRGSRFRICIPMLGGPKQAVSHRHLADPPRSLQRARPADALGWAAPPVPWMPCEQAASEVPATRERIVLAIDRGELRDYVTGLLRPHYRVQSLASAAEALRAISQRDADLVLVDLGKPAVEGAAFLRALRSEIRGSLVPALLLTSDTRATSHAASIEAGADDVIGKPFAAAELLARVTAHMRLSSQRRALHRRLTDYASELESEVARRTEALATSEAQFKSISNLVPDILWRTDADGRTEWRSEQWNDYTGALGDESADEFVHPDDRAATEAWVQETVEGQGLSPHEYRLRRSDGMYRWFIARMSAMRGSDGRIEHWFGAATDIEGNRVARHALEAQVGQGTEALARAASVEQELLYRLSQSQEDERRRIARELHDSLGQYLTALKLALSALAPLLADPVSRGLVVQLDALTTEVDRELDDIIAALRPVVLDEIGLAGALPGIVSDWSRQSGIAAETLLVQVAGERFDDECESTLYRIAQESLTNIVKHARASNVGVTLTHRQDELQLTVEDDGVGFEIGRHGGGWGLRGMAERARSVGGLLQVESTPQTGTTVLVRLPCRPRAASKPTG